MKFIQYYHLSTGYPSFKEENKRPIPAVGSDAVLVIPAQTVPAAIHGMAQENADSLNKIGKGYVGYTVMIGRSFTDAQRIQEYTSLDKKD